METGNESIRFSRSTAEAKKRIKAREQARKGAKAEAEGVRELLPLAVRPVAAQEVRHPDGQRHGVPDHRAQQVAGGVGLAPGDERQPEPGRERAGQEAREKTDAVRTPDQLGALLRMRRHVAREEQREAPAGEGLRHQQERHQLDVLSEHVASQQARDGDVDAEGEERDQEPCGQHGQAVGDERGHGR